MEDEMTLPYEGNARLIAEALARLAGEYESPTRLSCNRVLSPRDIILLVYRARRNHSERLDIIGRLACSLALVGQGRIDASRAGLWVVPRRRHGFHGLVRAVHKYYEDPGNGTLRLLVEALGGEIHSPCATDRVLEERRKRLEARMKAYGALLGLSLPLLFLASVYVDLLVGFLVVAVTALLWVMVAREGHEYRMLNIESAWRACLLGEEDLERILQGMPELPSPFEIIGVPMPRLD